MEIKLYDYQKVALSKIVPSLTKFGKALAVMATGLGKTIVSLFVVRKFINKSSRVLFLCHDGGILSQSRKKYESFFGSGYTYAEFFGTKKNWGADQHNFVFATFQSLDSHLFKSDRKNIFSPKHFDYIVVDESHHSKAETFEPVITYFKPKWILGITATPDREDEEDIRKIFGKEVVNYSLPEALAKGWLTKVVYKIMSDGIDQAVIDALVQEVLVDHVRMTERQLNEKLFIRKRTEAQVQTIVDETYGGRKALVFCTNIPHLEHVQEMMPSSVAMHSEQTDSENDFALNAFNGGLVQRMLAVDKFNEGMDVPDIDVLGFLRFTRSRRIWEQQLGRGLRKFPGKDFMTVLDFVGNIQRLKELKTFFNQIAEFNGSLKKNLTDELVLNEALHIEGDYFTFEFSAEVVNLFSALEYVDLPYYETWPEASKGAQLLGIEFEPQYREKYKQDPRLPSTPDRQYKDFPGWPMFLRNENSQSLLNFLKKYETWQEASLSSVALGITSKREYEKNHYLDKKLPSIPRTFYKDFPGWGIFLGTFRTPNVKNKVYYSTVEDASVAAIKIGILSKDSYFEMYKLDDKLPASPRHYYKNFPGWPKFLGKK